MSTACVCTGIRYCNICKDDRTGNRFTLRPAPTVTRHGKVLLHNGLTMVKFGSDASELVSAETLGFSGLTILENLISEEEERRALNESAAFEWSVSQSGRRKVDFCPVKVNFKKKKVSQIPFVGFPRTVLDFLDRARHRSDVLNGFRPIEIFYQHYTQDRLSNFDFHIDDTWAWGDRIVDLNMLGDAHMTFFRDGVMLDVPFPRRSCLILSGTCRTEWMHAILEDSFQGQRESITIREWGKELGQTEDGQRMLRLVEETPPIAPVLEQG